MPRAFALVDCDNFYVSCERVFDPGLRGRPVVVLSNNDGCIISRSDEAKALGIRMGAPLHEERRVVEAVERINVRLGPGAIKYAAALLHPRWRGRSEKRSPRYTTSWKDLLKIAA